MKSYRVLVCAVLVACSLLFLAAFANSLSAIAANPIDKLRARPMYLIYPSADPMAAFPSGYSPSQIRNAYNLPWGGSGTIAIIDAYAAPTMFNDLGNFSAYYGLPLPNSANYEEHQMVSPLSTDSGWALETALDVEWAHAIAPSAKILLVQAQDDTISHLLAAVNYARSRSDVVAVSMSWGSEEFPGQNSYDSYFTGGNGASFFASSGDSGAGAIWPSTSANVIAVGGTTLNLDGSGNVISETSWSGSGGGISAYSNMPSYQATYGLPGNKRSVPDVSYDANPSTGFPVYFTGSWYNGKIGGTSAGAPQWAAIQALGLTASNDNFYQDARLSSYSSYFRDITLGSNGAYFAGTGYDMVTGLGSPLTTDFTPSGNPATTITLLPAEQSTPLSPSNGFTVTYTNDGTQQSDFIQTTLTLNTDSGTNIVISGASTGSTPQEQWVFNSNADSFTIPAGSSQTLYYYNLLSQNVNYTIVGGGTPPNPTISYVAAPATASGNPQQTAATPQLSQLPAQTIWALRGSAASPTNPIVGNSTERWLTSTATLTITSPNQFPTPITYFHQYSATFAYQTTGGGTPTPPTLTATSLEATSTTPLPTSPSIIWLDATSQYALSNPLPSSTPTERWSTPAATSGTANGAVSISATFFHQFNLSTAYSLIGGGTPTPPNLTYTNYGSPASKQLTNVQQALWADSGTTYSTPPQLIGSTNTERWSTLANSGTIQTSTTRTFPYYHQFNISATYSLVGGGNPATPTFSSINFGNTTTITLTNTPQQFWADSNSQYSSPSQLDGSTQTERWSTPANSGSIQNSTALSLTYYRQFLLNATGTQMNTQWFNSGETAQMTTPGVSNRTAGTGQRLTSFTVDDGNSTPISSTSGNALISVLMDAPHQLQINSVTQYEVTLDAVSIRMLNLITPPTISGDNYWYDTSTPLLVTLNGVGSRTAGTGERLTSYSVDGMPTGIFTLGQIEAINIASLLSPQDMSATVVSQYQLTTSSGSVKSTTTPSIAGDTGWYDTGTFVTVTYDSAWNAVSGQSRLNAVSYTLSQGAITPLTRSNSGTFNVQVQMTQPESIDISSVTQYSLSLTGGNNVELSQASPTGDSFYDSGTTLSITTENMWGMQSGNVRQNLLSYTLNGDTTNVSRTDTGKFTTPTFTFISARVLAFNSINQYLASFQFTDNSGTYAITPSSFQINTSNPGVIDAPQFNLWLDSGTQIQIHSIIWQNTDVKPTNQATYTINSPTNATIQCRIFNGQIKVLDNQGTPAAGAQVTVTLSNQTTISTATDANGTLNLPMIPLGTFNATITYSGSTSTVSGDASIQTLITTVISPPASPEISPEIPEMPQIAAVIALIAATLLISVAIKKKCPHIVTAIPRCINLFQLRFF